MIVPEDVLLMKVYDGSVSRGPQALSGENQAKEEMTPASPLAFYAELMDRSIALSLRKSGAEEAAETFLESFGEGMKADRTAIFELKEGHVYHNTYEWCAAGILPMKEVLQNLPESMFAPGQSEAFREGSGYMIRDMEKLRTVDPAAFAALHRRNVDRFYVLPLFRSGKYAGFFSIDDPPEDMDACMPLFRMAAGYLSSLLEKRDAADTMHKLTYVDDVTGYYSIQVFKGYLDQAILENAGAGPGEAPELVCLNIRSFKVYNNRFGFTAGNRLLRRMGNVIHSQGHVRYFARTNGDHFYALTGPGCAEEVIRSVHEDMQQEGITVYAGICRLGQDEKDSLTAMDRAKMASDYALDDLNRYYKVFDDSMLSKLRLGSYLISHVDQAIRNDWIKVYYQPIVGTYSHKISSLEALSRWIDPTYGFLPPDRFIGVLEDARLLYKVDLFVLEKVCQGIHEAMSEGRPCCKVSINLSRHDLELEDLHERINTILEKYSVPHEIIHFEITETALISREDTIREHIRLFHDDGYEVWLDDFGSGYSSLNTMQKFDFDLVKIDMLFLRHKTMRTPVLMRSIVDMAKRMGMLTLTEGVETEEEFAFLRQLGCSYAQGYLFSKPLPIREVFQDTRLASLGCESRPDGIFYRQVAQVNVLSGGLSSDADQQDTPQLIVENAGGNSQTILYISDAGREYFDRVFGFQIGSLPQKVDEDSFSAMRLLDDLEDRADAAHDTVFYDFIIEKEIGRLKVNPVADYSGRHAYLIRIMNISAFENSGLSVLESVEDVYSLFEQVDEVIPSDNVYRHIYGEMDAAQKIERMTASQVYAAMADQVVHPAERSRFLAFLDMGTMEKRLEEAPRNVLNAFFHLLQPDGDFVWRRIVIRSLYRVRGKARYLVCVCGNTVGWDQDMILEQVKNKSLPDDISHDTWQGEGLDKGALWNAILSQKQLGIFWKDRERRFVGVNGAFLRYYNMTLTDLIGKTDEDMNWHPDPEPFRRDELRVLNEGVVISNAIGECLVEGEVRQIMANKAPIIENGRIKGLVGYFVDVTDAAEMTYAFRNTSMIDVETGLFSAAGFAANIQYFREHCMEEGDVPGCIAVRIDNLRRYRDTYGAEITSRLTKKLGQIFRNLTGERGIIGHMTDGCFDILLSCRDEAKLLEEEEKVSAAIKTVKTADGMTPFTPYFSTGSAICGQGSSIEDMVKTAEERCGLSV